jgi:RNA polymerase sigma factor (sigma-70 family)
MVDPENNNPDVLPVVRAINPSPENFLYVVGSNDDVGADVALSLERNIGLVATAVNMVMPEFGHNPTVLGPGLIQKIVNTARAAVATYGTYSEREDLFQEAAIRFIKKLPDYDKERGSLSTFMLQVMSSRINEVVFDTARGVRYPAESFRRRRKALEIIPHEMLNDTSAYGHENVDGDYTTRRLPAEEIALTPRFEVSGEPSGEIHNFVLNSTFQEAMLCLPERDLEILTLYFTPHVTENGDAQPRTLQDVSEELRLNLSKQRVSQIISESLEKIRKKMEEIETEKVRMRLNKLRLQELAETKLALGVMVIDHHGVVFKEEL